MAGNSHHRAGLIFLGACVALGIGIFALDQGKEALGRLATPTAAATSPARTVNPYQPITYPAAEQRAAAEPAQEQLPAAEGATATATATATTSDGAAPAQSDNGRALRGEAAEMARSFFAEGSNSEDEALAWLSAHYADQVEYFGMRKGRAAILRDKVAYIRRWPSRSYAIEPESLLVTCGDGQPLCHSRGIVDWSASSPERGADAQGKASFDLVTYNSPQGIVIVGENSKVIAR